MRLQFVKPDGETFTFAPLDTSPDKGVWSWPNDELEGKRDFTVRELVEALVRLNSGELWAGDGKYELVVHQEEVCDGVRPRGDVVVIP